MKALQTFHSSQVRRCRKPIVVHAGQFTLFWSRFRKFNLECPGAVVGCAEGVKTGTCKLRLIEGVAAARVRNIGGRRNRIRIGIRIEATGRVTSARIIQDRFRAGCEWQNLAQRGTGHIQPVKGAGPADEQQSATVFNKLDEVGLIIRL